MSATVTANTDGLDVLRKQLAKLKGLRLLIGYQGEKGATLYEGGANVATVAFWQEFGTIDVPARPSLRSAIRESAGAIAKIQATELARVFDTDNPADPVDAVARIGERVAAIVKRKIDTSRSWATPNAPSTAAKKGDNFPLHESDLMSESVTYTVRRGESILREGPR